MTEPTPPPERPLPDPARARIRAELLEHAHDHRSATAGWLVPVGAAAAVALVAGLAYWAINAGADEAGLPVTGGASSGASATPSVSDSAAVPTAPPSPPASVPSTAFSTPASGEPVEAGTGSCADELEYVLKGAQLALQVDDHSAFYVKGDRFVLCDTREGATTVTHPLPLQPREELATYRVLSLYAPAPQGYRDVRVAGGVVPAGAESSFDVAYAFPDGHTEHAVTATDDQGRTWWVMAYTYADDGGSELSQPRIRVDVTYAGTHDSYLLSWGVDTCAQANHGC